LRTLLLSLFAGCLVDEDTWLARRAALGDEDGDGVRPLDGDCDDADPLIHPGQSDGCDGVDNDCDGAVDEEPDALWYPDLDGDGAGALGAQVPACDAPPGWVAVGDDCDDADPDRHPARTERCDGRDDDCDGEVDDGLPLSSWYPDADGDGYGGVGPALTACAAPAGHVSGHADCDDDAADVNPAAPELCSDGVDNNCDGRATGCEWSSLLASTRVAGVEDGAAGSALAAGDLDGDGADEWIVGGRGAAWVMGGSGVRPVGAAITGGHSRATLALDDDAILRAATLCDLDSLPGDEIVLGVVLPDEEGAAYIVPGSSAGRRSEADASWTRRGTGDRLGAALACGDLDGDGHPDLLVGAPLSAGEVVDGGAIEVLRGPLVGEAAWAGGGTIRLTSTGPARVGSALALGDIDGDGLDDVVAGAPGPGTDATWAGAAWILYGPVLEDALLSELGTQLHADRAGGCAGTVAVGHVDADGYADVLVGAPGSDTPGAVYIVDGAELGPSTIRWALAAGGRIEGEGVGSALGTQVRVGPGRSGEGATVVATAPGEGAGAVYLWDADGLLSTTRTPSDADAWLHGHTDAEAVGSALAVGDVDGDAWLDLAVGAPGATDGGLASGAVLLVWGAGL
jgi:hypothetical protein